MNPKASDDPMWDFSDAVSMGLTEDGELVCAATVRAHPCHSFVELVAFATHKHHYRQGKGRIMAAVVKEYAQHEVSQWHCAVFPVASGQAPAVESAPRPPPHHR